MTNEAKILGALDALYATQGIVDDDAAEARGLAVRAVDAFYAKVTGEPVGAAIRRMEATPASKRWRDWSEEP